MDQVLLILRALALCASFGGLCAAVRSALKLDRFITPFFAMGGIIVLLMWAGMLNVLPYAFYLLYGAGFAGLAYAYFIRREKPDWLLIGIFALFVAFLTWRYYPVKVYRWDDISHWALVARHVLRFDAFPDATTDTVFFQSYPLGSAAFIYYVVRTLGDVEGLWMIAHDFMMGVAFLPVLANIRGNRKWLWPVGVTVFMYLFGFVRRFETLQVDWLLGFVGIGLLATVFRYRDDWKRALLAVVPAALAVVYMKSSGMFFAMLAVMSVAFLVKQQGCGFWRVLIVGTATVIGAYMLWTMHVKFAFPAGMETKHAISMSSYAARASDKSAGMILSIGRDIVRKLLHPDEWQAIAALFMAGTALFCAVAAKIQPVLKKAFRTALQLLLFGVGIYMLWNVMLFVMYIVSMPIDEALELASFERYNQTCIVLVTGLTAVALLGFVSEMKICFAGWVKALYCCTMVGGIAVIALVCVAHPHPLKVLLLRNTEYIPPREKMMQAHQQINLEPGAKYMVYWLDSENRTPSHTLFYHVKYEFNTTDVITIVHQDRAKEGEPQFEFAETVALTENETSQYSFTSGADRVFDLDPISYIAERIDTCDAFIVADDDPAIAERLEEFLSQYDGEIPVYYAFEKE